MDEDDARQAGALGARGQHIFLAKLGQHRATRQSGNAGERVEGEHGGGEGEMGEGVAEGARLAGEPGVDRAQSR